MPSISELAFDLLQKGYSPDSVRGFLKQKGYKKDDIEQAIEEAGFSLSTSTRDTHIKHTHHVAASGIIFMLLIFLLGAGAVYFLMTVLYTGEALLDVEVEPDKISLYPGEEISFTLKIINLGSKDRFDATARYKIIDSSGRSVLSQEETFAISTSLTKDKKIPSPKESGTYKLEVNALYDGKIASSSFTFAVKEDAAKIVEEPLEEVDSLIESKLYSRAEEKCLDLEERDRDDCLSLIVKDSREPRFCNEMVSVELKDNCLMSFIVEGQTYLCSSIVLESNQQYCDRIADVQLLAKYYQES